MFALGIRYLNGWAMATHPADRGRAEWPPHPDRIFMALAAAYFETDGNADERAALEWLQSLEPPSLAASEANHRTIVTSYVPVNDTAVSKLAVIERALSQSKAKDAGLALLPEYRPRQARQFPVALPDVDPQFPGGDSGMPHVYLIWPEVEATSRQGQVLQLVSEKVTSIGHSASLVQMWVEPSPPAATLVPLNGMNVRHRLRIAGLGRLGQLEARYRAALRPTSSLWQGYGEPPSSASEAQPRSSHFDSNLLIVRRDEGPRLGLESTVQLTEALRDTVMSRCPVQPPPVWVSGHNPNGTPAVQPHLAFVPLSHVGHQHAEGHLLGVAIAVPRAVSAEEQSRCLGPVLFTDQGMPAALNIQMGRVGLWIVTLVEGDDARASLRPATWTAAPTGAKRWATVTPIVFDRHPKAPGDAEQTIGDSCERIGLPRPKEVILASASMFIGAPHARRFPNLQRKAGGNLHHTHAIMSFDAPVVGPVLLGAGRYRGYGQCRPLQEGGRE